MLLSPWGLVALAAALAPVLGVGLAARRSARVARTLRLSPPSPWPVAAVAGAAALGIALVALAAAQPALETTQRQAVRSTSEAMVVVDVSRSMLASPAAGEPTRLDRARAVVRRLRAGVPGVRMGLAGMTDRVLPYLFPTADAVSFDQTLARSVLVEQPPPGQDNTVATTFDGLAQLVAGGYFARSTKHRACVVVTDGEARTGSAEEPSGGFQPSSGGFQSLGSEAQPAVSGGGSLDNAFDTGVGADTATGAAALAGSDGCRLVVVRVGGAGDRIHLANGRVEGQYRPLDTAAASVADLAAAAGGQAFGASDVAAAAAAVRAVVETGPTTSAAVGRTVHRLAPWLALAGVLLLAVLVAVRVLRPECVRDEVFEYAASLAAPRGGRR